MYTGTFLFVCVCLCVHDLHIRYFSKNFFFLHHFYTTNCLTLPLRRLPAHLNLTCFRIKTLDRAAFFFSTVRNLFTAPGLDLEAHREKGLEVMRGEKMPVQEMVLSGVWWETWQWLMLISMISLVFNWTSLSIQNKRCGAETCVTVVRVTKQILEGKKERKRKRKGKKGKRKEKK